MTKRINTLLFRTILTYLCVGMGSSLTVLESFAQGAERKPPVTVRIEGIPVKKVQLQHYRIDRTFSNSYETWKTMGSPRNPATEQIAQLEKAGQLQLVGPPESVTVANGEAVLNFALPRQGRVAAEAFLAVIHVARKGLCLLF